jgi:hypothetical protein
MTNENLSDFVIFSFAVLAAVTWLAGLIFGSIFLIKKMRKS